MHYEGVKEHPKEFEDWYDLVNALGTHAVERYGAANVSTWSFEVWSECTFPASTNSVCARSSLAAGGGERR